MKTIAEQKFDSIINDSFKALINPLGFKKKGNNFYRQLPEFGQIVNVQKSMFYSKENIHFTINTGLFIPEYWLTFYTYHEGKIPEFPTESICAIRKRIGELKYGKDKWFEIDADTNIDDLKNEMSDNVRNYIIPYFERTKTKPQVIELLQDEKIMVAKFTRLIIYGEYGYDKMAQAEYEKLRQEKYVVNNLISSLIEYRDKYNLKD